MQLKNFAKLIIAIVISESAGIIGSFFTIPSISGWYAGTHKENCICVKLISSI